MRDPFRKQRAGKRREQRDHIREGRFEERRAQAHHDGCHHADTQPADERCEDDQQGIRYIRLALAGEHGLRQPDQPQDQPQKQTAAQVAPLRKEQTQHASSGQQVGHDDDHAAVLYKGIDDTEIGVHPSYFRRNEGFPCFRGGRQEN